MSPKAEDIRKAVGVLLDIPDIEVKEVVESRDGSYLVTAISTKTGTDCHKCGKWDTSRIHPTALVKRLEAIGQTQAEAEHLANQLCPMQRTMTPQNCSATINLAAFQG